MQQIMQAYAKGHTLAMCKTSVKLDAETTRVAGDAMKTFSLGCGFSSGIFDAIWCIDRKRVIR